ncbi:hypothetical protein [Streptomyces sp. NPDC046976]|uniref:hypothetical protein n=1 Tax=Streptomyces sp. NPDC046976 TaxID=3155258 RepID=UPI0033D0E635
MTEEVGEDGRVPVAEAPLRLPVEFEELYILHQEGFHKLALAVLGTNDAAERAVHRAFLEILQPVGQAEGGEPEQGPPQTLSASTAQQKPLIRASSSRGSNLDGCFRRDGRGRMRRA